MTAEIINLRRARKAKARSERARAADENRARHGRSKAERARDEAATSLAEKHLDGHRIGPDSPDRGQPDDGGR